MKLVDTSSWVEYLREANSAASDRVEALVLSDAAAWCDMTLVELWHGVRGAREKRELAELQQDIERIPVDMAVWNRAFVLARHCRENGLTVPHSDIIIAACAVNYDLKLEHCDSHFDKIMPIAKKL